MVYQSICRSLDPGGGFLHCMSASCSVDGRLVCDGEDRLVSLRLVSFGASGVIPTDIWELQSLRTLVLHLDQLRGEIYSVIRHHLRREELRYS